MTHIPDRTSLQASCFKSTFRPPADRAIQSISHPLYCQSFTQPQLPQPRDSYWLEPYTLSCQGSKPYLPFALFTTLLRRVRLSQGIRRLCGMYIISHKNINVEAWLVGDRSEDEKAAAAAGINFCSATVWRDRFLPGISDHPVSREQLEFLEGIKP